MLIGNRGKYLGIILGIAFAALLIAQQSSIFCGLMSLTTSQIKDVHGVDIWVICDGEPRLQRLEQHGFAELAADRSALRSVHCGVIDLQEDHRANIRSEL
jgi:hypothetical protein